MVDELKQMFKKISLQNKRLKRIEDVVYSAPNCEECGKQMELVYACSESEVIQSLKKMGKIRPVSL